MNKNKAKLFKKYNIEMKDWKQMKEGLAQLIEELKQKISAKTQRLARYKKRQDQYYHNKFFKTDCKKFYNRLGKTYRIVKEAPDKERIRTSGGKYMRKKLCTLERRAGLRTKTNHSLTWNGNNK